MGQIGAILGKAKVNISAMTLGRREKGGSEMTVLNVDSQVPDEVIKELSNSKFISGVRQIKL